MTSTDKSPMPNLILELNEDQSGFHVGPKAHPKLGIKVVAIDVPTDDDLLHLTTATVERAAARVSQAVLAEDDLMVAQLDRILRAAKRLLALAQRGVAASN